MLEKKAGRAGATRFRNDGHASEAEHVAGAIDVAKARDSPVGVHKSAQEKIRALQVNEPRQSTGIHFVPASHVTGEGFVRDRGLFSVG